MPSLLREAKYKKTVEAVYGEAGPNAHNIQSLQQYALMTPGKLPKIGKYVLNKAKEGLKEKKKGVRTVTTSMTIFNELIKTCHSDLALFASPVCEMMTLLLSSADPEFKAAGTETFIRFAEHGGIQYELEKYVQYFLDMSSCTMNDPDLEKEMRVYGLRGLHAFIMMTEDLDNLIAHFVDTNVGDKSQMKLLPIFLDNMQYKRSGDPAPSERSSRRQPKKSHDRELTGPWKEASIPKLATLCLKDMAARVNHITVRPLCESMLQYIDEKQLWEPNDFAVEALRSLSIGVLPQMYNTVVRFLLDHLDRQPADAAAMRTSMVQCIQEIMPKTITLQMSEVMACLIRQISSTQAPIDQSLASASIDAISLITSKQSDPIHRFDAIREILLQLSTPGLTTESKVYMCQGILRVNATLKKLPADKSCPPSLVEDLCLIAKTEESQIRLHLLNALHQLLVRGELLKRMHRKIHCTGGHFANPYEKCLMQIHASLLLQAQQSDNTLSHYQMMYLIHSQLLEELHGPVCSILLLSNLFHLQETQKELSSSNAVLAHTMVLALVAKVASHRSLPSLAQYAQDIKKQRDDAKEIPASVSVEMKDGSFTTNEEAETSNILVTVLFEKDTVLGILSEDKELSSVFDLGNLFEQNNFVLASSDSDVDSAKLEERRKRKELAIGISSTNVRRSVPTLDLPPQWNAAIFCGILNMHSLSTAPPLEMFSFDDISSLVSQRNDESHTLIQSSFEDLEMERDSEPGNSLLVKEFPRVSHFL